MSALAKPRTWWPTIVAMEMVVADGTIEDDNYHNPHINDVEHHGGPVLCQFQVRDVVLYSNTHLAVPSDSIMLGLVPSCR